MKKKIVFLLIVIILLTIPASFAEEQNVSRIAGRNRIQTCVNIMNNTSTGPNYSLIDGVVIASSESYPDALCAGPLCHYTRCLLLINPPNELALQNILKLNSIAYFKNAKLKKIYIIGGTSAISTEVEEKLRAYSDNIVRLGGMNRYETCYNVAEEILNYKKNYDFIYVSGENFPDALIGNLLAPYYEDPSLNSGKINGGPILLVKKNTMPEPIKLMEKSYPNAKRAFIVGGKAVISDEVERGIGIQKKIRFAGKNRYETSKQVINYREIGHMAPEFMIVSGENYPDALAAGVWAMRGNAFFVLSEKKQPTQYVKDLLKDSWHRVLVGGGPSALSETYDELKYNKN